MAGERKSKDAPKDKPAVDHDLIGEADIAALNPL